MSNPCLPAEILDDIVDHLHGTQDALRNCCLVSKSWIPRTRKHLFADIAFPTAKSLRSWKEMFPDPSTSLACYAKTLSLKAPDAEVGSWIRGFSRVVHLEVGGGINLDELVISLAPLHGSSPVIKSLRVAALTRPSLRIFDLIFLFPLLEDLAVIVHGMPIWYGRDNEEDEMQTGAHPLSPPVLTGSLELDPLVGMGPFTRRLLSLPGGIHFQKLTLTWRHDKDPLTTTRLVEECSHTLKSLDITWGRSKSI
jgi:hypothetical protein